MRGLWNLAASSVGIIGGADGPTAIFVASSGWLSTAFLIAGAALALGAAIVWIREKKRR